MPQATILIPQRLVLEFPLPEVDGKRLFPAVLKALEDMNGTMGYLPLQFKNKTVDVVGLDRGTWTKLIDGLSKKGVCEVQIRATEDVEFDEVRVVLGDAYDAVKGVELSVDSLRLLTQMKVAKS